jgi:hypothetical protein
MSGRAREQYESGVVEGEHLEGHNVALLRSATEDPDLFGTLMQVIDGADFRGRRMRLRGAVRPVLVERWAGLWLRVDLPTGRPSAFDNME